MQNAFGVQYLGQAPGNLVVFSSRNDHGFGVIPPLGIAEFDDIKPVVYQKIAENFSRPGRPATIQNLDLSGIRDEWRRGRRLSLATQNSRPDESKEQENQRGAGTKSSQVRIPAKRANPSRRQTGSRRLSMRHYR
jgi:hypothetical protein